MRTVDALRAHTSGAQRLKSLLVLLFISLFRTTQSSEELVVGPAHEINGQTLQGALSQYSGQWSLHTAQISSRLLSPYGVAVSKDGSTVYVGEAYKHRVRAIDVQSGSATTIAGGNRGNQDGPAASSKFSWPYGVALSPDGETLYVADSGNDCIRAVSVSTGIVSTLAGSGSRGHADGAAEESRFSWPYGVGVSPDGSTVYVADSGNNRIRAVSVESGEVRTLAGQGPAGFADGPAATAKFYGPRAVVVSPDGTKLYVADYSNFRVRAIDLVSQDKYVTTILNGGGNSNNGGGGGEFYRPAGVAVTPDGSIVLSADSANSRVQSVRVANSSPLAPSPLLDEGEDVEVLPPSEYYRPGRDNFTSSDFLDNSAGVLDPFRDVFFGDIDLDEGRQKRVITAVILFLILGVFVCMGIVTIALWQRRNALLMLRYYQNSSQMRYPEAMSPTPPISSSHSDIESSPDYGALPPGAHPTYSQAPHPYIRRTSSNYSSQPKLGSVDSPPTMSHPPSGSQSVFRRNFSNANLSNDSSSRILRAGSNGSSAELTELLGGPNAWQEV